MVVSHHIISTTTPPVSIKFSIPPSPPCMVVVLVPWPSSDMLYPLLGPFLNHFDPKFCFCVFLFGAHSHTPYAFSIVFVGLAYTISQSLSECPIRPQTKQNVLNRSYLKLIQLNVPFSRLIFILRFNVLSISIETQILYILPPHATRIACIHFNKRTYLITNSLQHFV